MDASSKDEAKKKARSAWPRLCERNEMYYFSKASIVKVQERCASCAGAPLRARKMP